MLKQLTIRNYALIKHLEMRPSAGLNVITGETGAGKSIMLGAVGLLLGNRADTRVLWDEKEKCITEAEFDISAYGLESVFRDEELDYSVVATIRREMSANGKSRAFINDTPVTLETLEKIGGRLMNIHSQHETLELGSRRYQLQLIDSFARNQKQTSEYGRSWGDFLRVKEKYEEVLKEAANLQQESDFIKYQLDELVKAGLLENEQADLESELKIQEHAEEIKKRLSAAAALLGGSEYSVRSALADIRNHLGPLAAYGPVYEEQFKRVESVRIELDDILRELERAETGVEFDQGRFEEISARLTLIYQLLQKHRVKDIGELIVLRSTLQERADKTNNLDSLLRESKRQLDQAQAAVEQNAAALSRTRVKTFEPLAGKITGLLRELGIPDAQVLVEHSVVAAGPSGVDSIEIMFSANKGIKPRPLAQVASGGEFSRLMFCVKHVMAERTAMPTLVLDEIDTGVSGETAMSLGRLMKEMSARHQVIAISHLPQIAAKGDAHYFVFKDSSARKAVSVIKKLDDEGRIEEIAKMIGGARPSATAMENARELINS